MLISADIFVVPPQPIAAAVPPPPRPAVSAPGERESAQNQRRESTKGQDAPLSFRGALGAAGIAGAIRAKAHEQAWQGEGEERRPRAERLPSAGPVELSSLDAMDLFTQAVENNARKSFSPAFAAPASNYAASYLAGSSFYARPGESLELTA